MITDLTIEFRDKEALRSNLTRARHLMDESGLDEETFYDLLYEAWAITKRQGNIEKPATSGDNTYFPGTRNKMPYFWAVVEDLLSEGTEEAAESQ